MFGYVRPCLESLDEAQKKRYRDGTADYANHWATATAFAAA